MSYVLKFSDPEAELLPRSGGKGSSLSKLFRAGFPVPPGFIVTPQGYAEFFASVPGAWEAVEALPFDSPDRLVPAAAALRERMKGVLLPEGLAAEVREALAGMEPGAYSVRSSSTLEDLAGAAFAGQHDTYLNCVGAEEILDRIRACFISLWQDRAVAYRHSRGFGQREAAMAVVVQRMVRCDTAGVGFSVDPIAGRDVMLINADWGLGESVVGGESEVDQFVVDRKSRRVVSSFIAHKARKIVSSDCGTGTETVEVPGEEADRPSLDEGQIAALGDLMLKVESFYNFPQDIEWGFEGKELFLLQSRPVTSIAPLWTRDESAERYPSAMTPMSWDLIEEGFHQSLDHSFKMMGFPPLEGKWFALFDNYVYGNQNAVRFYLGRLPFMPRSAEELRAGIGRFVEEHRWALFLPAEWRCGLDRYLLRLGALGAEPLGTDPAELWDYVSRICAAGGEYFRPNIAISITQSILYRSLLCFLKLFAPEEAMELFDRITACCETKTGLVNRDLQRLADRIRADGELLHLVRGMDSRELLESGKLEAWPAFAEAFRRFLEDHGHREVEFDPYIPTWSGAPWVVMDNLRLMAASPEECDGMQVRATASEAEDRLFALVPEDLHLLFREIIRLVRLYTELDDEEHYETTRLHLLIRRGLFALGRALTAQGVLADPGDIFFARRATMDACVSGATPWDGLKREVGENKAAYEANRKRAPRWTLGPDGEEQGPGPAGDGAGELNGLAGSPGMAEGPVFIVRSSDDFASFPPGAVLVARTTNPAWTPLFHAACALVTESGGPLSHGAVTAREMGIPAVMSVRGVLGVLRDGDRVRVDGTRGQVLRLSEVEPSGAEG